ncbi:MAG: hydroxymethylglutaryl-CoA lyase [Bdellovibrionota bacterium]
MTKIKIVEVGPRDGLQNEKKFLKLNIRCEFISKLVDAGLKDIEIGAFVSSEKIPQMAGSAEIVKNILNTFPNKDIHFPVLVPNERGMNDAITAGAKEVAVFTAASESFSMANINCTIEESFKRFEPVMALAKKHKIKVRGYLSTCFYCPYEGKIKPQKVVPLAKKLIAMGCYQVSIGDTLGAANPKEVKTLIQMLKRSIPIKKLAMHFHDTRGTALANILQSYELGITTFDSSLGGFPYAPGAQGNVSTEDVVYMFDGMGVKTGVDLAKLIEVNHWMTKQMEKALPSRVGKAGLPKI